MLLYKKGVTVEYADLKDINFLKRHGYTEVKESEIKPKVKDNKPPVKKEGE